jgi:hypothetical protein
VNNNHGEFDGPFETAMRLENVGLKRNAYLKHETDFGTDSTAGGEATKISSLDIRSSIPWAESGKSAGRAI